MNSRVHANSLLAGGAAFNFWLIVVVWQSTSNVSAQEAVRNALAAETATETRKKLDLESMPYTVKSGDLRLLVTPSAELDWNDNINVTKTNELQDFVARPRVTLDASYPLTQFNLLQLDVGAGYDKYISHDNYSSWQINSGSQLSFDTYVKNILINLHDRFSYTQDAGSQAVVTGSGNYGTANNVAGVLISWNPNKLNLVLGYDHQNTISLTSQFQSQDNAAELIDGRVGWRFIPTATAGAEATYSSVVYDQTVLNNNNTYTLGVYGEWHPGSYFDLSARAGVSINDFQNTSQSGQIFISTPSGNPIVIMTGQPIRTADQTSYYANLTVSHSVSEAVSYSLSIGHDMESGVSADAIEESYLRVAFLWKVIRLVDVDTSISYEHGQQGAGNIQGNLTEGFDYFTGNLTVSHQLTKRIRVGMNYRLTLRSSTDATMEYTQNLVGLQLTYAFE